MQPTRHVVDVSRPRGDRGSSGCRVNRVNRHHHARCGKLREALEADGLQDVMIMSYAAKFASAFYGPYRDAIGSGKLGTAGPADKKTYQMDSANTEEALRLIEDGLIPTDVIVSHTFPLEKAEEAIEFSALGDGIKVAVIP